MPDQNQNQAQQNADAQRRAAEEQRRRQSENTGVAGPQQGGQPPRDASAQPQLTDSQRAEAAANRRRFDEEKKLTAERPQQVGDDGQKPTPTQQENDEIRNGLRHIDDKEDDGSGPDFVHNRVVRRVEADQAKGKYETR